MDPVSGNKINISPEELEKMRENIKQVRKDNLFKEIIMPNELRKFLTENPDLWELDKEKGVIVIDEKNIPPQFLKFLKQADTTFEITRFSPPNENANKPFGMI